MTKISPSELIAERNRAFAMGDFGFIFDTFHPDSNFRRQFPARDEYVAVGQSSLSQDFHILSCEILHERVSGDEAQVIFLMQMKAQGVLQQYAELAWLKADDGEWRYHRGLKVADYELPDDPEALTLEYFAKLDQSTVF
jgi:SEC-C motif-containing protein